jgi:hypothetical protein
MPKYSIRNDSATHITVIHIDNSELMRIKTDPDTSFTAIILPDVKIKNGIIDHKAMTGELYVREYYIDSLLMGYVEYDGTNMKREIYYNADGNIYLEKRYIKGNIDFTNNSIQAPPSPPLHKDALKIH